jgi:hypothetical protein
MGREERRVYRTGKRTRTTTMCHNMTVRGQGGVGGAGLSGGVGVDVSTFDCFHSTQLNSLTHLLTAVGAFGPWCPVALLNDEALVKSRDYPVLYRRHVYCLSSAPARRLFLADPAKCVGWVGGWVGVVGMNK